MRKAAGTCARPSGPTTTTTSTSTRSCTSPPSTRQPYAPTSAAATAVAFARAQLGTPYVWGGDGPADGGFDCSGLTQAAYHAAGIALLRVVQDQYDAGPHLPKGTQLALGDLLFYGTSPSHITHVAIYTGGGQAIDAPQSGAVVRQGPARTDTPAFQGATRPAAPGGGGAR